MLVVNYNGNKPVNDYFKFSVQGNNNADIVRFVLLKKQGNIDLTNENYRVYAKCQTPDQDFVDKTMLTTTQEVDNNLIVDWALLSKHTENKQLQVSLSFEDLNNEIVWQTQIFTLNISNGILADQEIENTYPTILAQLQQQIDNIPNVESAQSGTIQDALGLNNSGKLVKGAVSGGTKLYLHTIKLKLKSDPTKTADVYYLANYSDQLSVGFLSSFVNGRSLFNGGRFTYLLSNSIGLYTFGIISTYYFINCLTSGVDETKLCKFVYASDARLSYGTRTFDSSTGIVSFTQTGYLDFEIEDIVSDF